MTGHIIVVDPVVGNRILLRSRLLSAYYTVEAFDQPEPLLQGDCAARADLIFLADTVAAREILSLLRGDPGTAHIPVILTGELDATEPLLPFGGARGAAPARPDGWHAGADDVLRAPLEDPALFARLKMLISLKRLEDDVRAVDPAFSGTPILPFAQTRPCRMLLLYGPSAAAETLATQPALGALDRQTFQQVDAEEQVHARVLDCPDTGVILWLAEATAAGPALRVLAQLRADPLTRLTPVLALVAGGDARLGAQAMELGACDAMSVDQPAEIVAARLRAAERRMQRAAALRAALVGGMRLALTDPMTGLHNRRHALSAGPQLLDRSLRDGHPFTVVMLDIDHFKAVNDTHGHMCGDQVLKVAARRMKQAVRPNDIVARIGGEEFLIALPATSSADALQVAERVRVSIAARPISIGGDRPPLAVTISAGVAEHAAVAPRGGRTVSFDTLIDQADKALYVSKNSGRNRVVAAPPCGGIAEGNGGPQAWVGE